jgi:hypothetical protein
MIVKQLIQLASGHTSSVLKLDLEMMGDRSNLYLCLTLPAITGACKNSENVLKIYFIQYYMMCIILYLYNIHYYPRIISTPFKNYIFYVFLLFCVSLGGLLVESLHATVLKI